MDALLARGLPRRPDGRPAWPPGVVGSITHLDDRSFAAVLGGPGWHGLGIDSERVMGPEVAAEVLPVCTDADERARLPSLPAMPWPAMALVTTVLFSAKESFFKALGETDPRALEFSTARLLRWLPLPVPPNPAPGPTADLWARLWLAPAPWLQRRSCEAEVVVAEGCVHTAVALR